MEKWQIALHATPLWLLYSFLGVSAASALVCTLLGRTTRFGQMFWSVTRPCLDAKSIRLILLLSAVTVLLLLTDIRLNVLSTFMTAGLLNSLQRLDAQAFWLFVAVNIGIVLLRGINGVANDFLDQGLAIKWSQRLNAVLVDRWLDDKNYYRLHMRRHAPDNIDQRIQQDAQEFIADTIEFARGMLNSVMSSIEFTIVLWGLAGILQIFGFTLPKGLVFFAFVFVLLATVLAMWIGKPLIRHHYENERLNGDYRYALIRIRDHAESVAFYNGEAQERHGLHQRFAGIIRNRWRIARQSVALNGFNELFSSSIQLLPVIMQAPRVLAKEIQIGDVQQTVQVFARLQKALSFFRLFYERFTAYRARLERLHGFLHEMEHRTHTAQADVDDASDGLSLHDVTLYRNNGDILLSQLNVRLERGDALLIQGHSGCGKTSLLRTLAGLWPFGSSGQIRHPGRSHTLFLPQRPYTPQGSLRQAICYPDIDPQHPELDNILHDCRLEHLIRLLDKTDDWQHKLSPGELQRIAFVRILLTRPRVILLDEATSALDEATEAHLYRLIRRRLSDSIIVSIGHRNTLSAFHNRRLQVGQGCPDSVSEAA